MVTSPLVIMQPSTGRNSSIFSCESMISTCVYRKLRFGRIGGAAHRRAHETQCVRSAEADAVLGQAISDLTLDKLILAFDNRIRLGVVVGLDDLAFDDFAGIIRVYKLTR